MFVIMISWWKKIEFDQKIFILEEITSQLKIKRIKSVFSWNIKLLKRDYQF